MEKWELLDLFTDTARMQSAQVDRMLAPLKLRQGQSAIITKLGMYGPCSQKELADARNVTPATISIMLGRMERSGLILRSAAEGSGKTNQISLTPEGRRTYERLSGSMGPDSDLIFAGIAQEDLEAAERVFRRISANLEKMRSGRAG